MSLYCTFTVDRYFLGIPVDHVQEVVRHQELSRVPLSRPEVRGLINLRGQIVTAIDLRCRLRLPALPAGENSMNVFIKTPEGTVSLLVDQIEDVLEVSDETVEQAPATLQGEIRELITGASKQKERILLLLNTGKTIELGAA
ncbi:MAG: chemotaxis protein CheW [Opitutaceae bacterium]|jgi:purine-binding chemotaxis protein CheW